MSSTIIMNRGDTVTLDINILDSGSDTGTYVMKDDDALYFGVMDPNQLFEDALIKKKYTADDCSEDGVITVVLDPEDTIDLYPGRYYYAVKLHAMQYDDEGNYIDKVITIVNNSKFVICD